MKKEKIIPAAPSHWCCFDPGQHSFRMLSCTAAIVPWFSEGNCRFWAPPLLSKEAALPQCIFSEDCALNLPTPATTNPLPQSFGTWALY